MMNIKEKAPCTAATVQSAKKNNQKENTTKSEDRQVLTAVYFHMEQTKDDAFALSQILHALEVVEDVEEGASCKEASAYLSDRLYDHFGDLNEVFRFLERKLGYENKDIL